MADSLNLNNATRHIAREDILNKLANFLRGAMGEITNFYNLSPRLLMFGTHIPPVTTMNAAKFH